MISTDGIDHINVYSQGATELGRLLTNFAHTPFECEDGHFESVEGYWYWLSCKDDHLRTLVGFEAKRYGRSVRAKDWVNDPEFQTKICRAIAIKILSNNSICDMMIQSRDLPFLHYYVYKEKIVNCPEAHWMMTLLTNIRADLIEASERHDFTRDDIPF